MGFEDQRANVPASMVSTATYVVAVFLSLYMGWDLMGIAVGLFLMRALELPVRLIPVMRRLKEHKAEPLEKAVSRRIFVFSGQSLVLMLITLIVWDRSEMVILKNFCPDIRQVAFYSVAFNITERLLVFSQIFGTATGVTMMAEHVKDATRLRNIAGTAVRYLALIAFPVHLGLGGHCRAGDVDHLRAQVHGSGAGAGHCGMHGYSQSVLSTGAVASDERRPGGNWRRSAGESFLAR